MLSDSNESLRAIADSRHRWRLEAATSTTPIRTGTTLLLVPIERLRMDDDRAEAIERLRTRDPGEDTTPYADVNVSELPEWWQKAKQEFEAFGLRPYRPPRFEDGTLKYEVVDELEAELDVEISFTSIDSAYTEEWELRVEGEIIDHVGRFRSPEGYTVYEIDSDEFVDLIESAVRDR